MRDVHVDSELSAYLDGELAPAERTRVDAHLAGCERCSRRLAELRATASLVSALPAPRLSRSLVPRVTRPWRWLRPVRALSAIATGAFLFAFLVTAIGRSGSGLGGGDESTAIFGGSGATTAASAPAAAPAFAPSASSAATGPASGNKVVVPGAPSPAVQAVPAPAASARPAAAPQASAPAVAREAQAADRAARATRGSAPGALLDPLFWLGLAVIAAVAAIAAHRRLRGA